MSLSLSSIVQQAKKGNQKNEPTSLKTLVEQNKQKQALQKVEEDKALISKGGRLPMQAAIGAATGAAYATPPGLGLGLSYALAPQLYEQATSDVQRQLLEQEYEDEAYRQMFEGLRKKAEPFHNFLRKIAPDYFKEEPSYESDQLPKLIPEAMKKGAEEAKAMTMGKEGDIIAGLASAPFRAAGIETTPKGALEQGIRFTSELATGLHKGGMPLATAQSLAFDLTSTLPQQALRSVANKFKKSPEKTTKDLLESLFSDLPKESAEFAIKEMYKPFGPKISHPSKPIETAFPSFKREEAKDLLGRVTVPEKPYIKEPGVKPEPRIGSVVSPSTYKNKAVGGGTLREVTQKTAKAEREAITNLYKIAEKEYANIEDVYPTLVSKLENHLANLERSASPNSGEKVVIKEINELLHLLGDESGYKSVPIDRLLKTADSISGTAKYEMPFNGPKDILKVIVKDINETAKTAIKNNKGNVQALLDADKAYSNFAQRFFNDEIKPFLEKTKLNSEEIFDKATNFSNPKHLRALIEAHKPYSEATQFVNIAKREMVEDVLSKFIKDPSKINSKEYVKTLANLEPLIGKKEINEINRRLKNYISEKAELITPKPKFKTVPFTSKEAVKKMQPLAPSKPFLKVPNPKDYTKDVGLTSKYVNEPVSKIKSMMNTPEGIRALAEDAAKHPIAKKHFELLKAHKLREIIESGKVKNNLTGNSLFETLNNKKNFELVKELVGNEPAKLLLNLAENLAKTEADKALTKAKFKKVMKFAGAAIVGTKVYSLISDLLK